MSRIGRRCNLLRTVTLSTLLWGNLLACGSSGRVANSSVPVTAAPEPEVKPWMRRFGGIAHEAVNSLVSDGDGGVIIAGDFFDRLDLDGIGLSSSGRLDAYVARLSESGTVTWATAMGGEGLDTVTAVSTDGSGGVWVGGEFEGRAAVGDHVLSADGIPEYFLARFAQDGALAWVRSLGGVRRYLSVSVAADSTGNVYVNHIGDASDVRAPVFLAMLDPSGEEVWRRTPEAGSDGELLVSRMALDEQGESITIVGTFRGRVGIGGGVQPSRNDSWDGIAARFDTQGNLLWEQRFSGDGNDFGQSIVLNGGVTYVAGLFSSRIAIGRRTLDAPPLAPDVGELGGRSFDRTSASMFIAALGESGDPLWATNDLLENPKALTGPGSPAKEGFSISWKAAQPDSNGPLLHSRLMATCGAHQLAVVGARSGDARNAVKRVAVSIDDQEQGRWRIVYFESDGTRATGPESALPDWGTTYGIVSDGSHVFAAGSIQRNYADRPARGGNDIFVARL